MAGKTNKLKKAINYWTIGGFEGEKPVAKAMAEAAKMGYEGLELCFGAGELTPKTKQSTCREIKKAAKAAGIVIPSLATGAYWGMSLSSPKKSERTKAIKFTQKYIEVAAMLGVTKILVVPGAVAVPWDKNVPVVPYDEVWFNSQQSLKELLPMAEEHKVTICIENVWNQFLLGPLEMMIFIDTLESKYVGSYFDVGNCILTGYAEHWIKILDRRIKCVHFKNFSRQDCGGTIFGFGDDLLKGDVNYKAVMKAFKEIKFTGFATAEMLPFSRGENMVLPDMKLARATSKKMDKIFAM